MTQESSFGLQCYFITGTGRCATKLFTKLLSLSRRSVCEHEKMFRHHSLFEFFRNGDFSKFREDIDGRVVNKVEQMNHNDMIYGVSSGHLYPSIPYLYKLFGPRARFILLVRRPEDFVRSALARGFFEPNHPKYCNQVEPSRTSNFYGNWVRMSSFEKCLWYWNYVNSYVIEAFDKIPSSLRKIIRIEDLNVDLVQHLNRFLGLSDILDKDINSVLSRRINASPGGDKSDDINPNSLPITMPPFDEWNGTQTRLLEHYAGKLRYRIYMDRQQQRAAV